MEKPPVEVILIVIAIIAIIAIMFYLQEGSWHVGISIYDQEVPIDSYIKVHCEIKPGCLYGDLKNVNVSWWIQPTGSPMEYRYNYSFIEKIHGGEIHRFEVDIDIDNVPKGDYYTYFRVFSEGVKKSLKLAFSIYDPDDYS